MTKNLYVKLVIENWSDSDIVSAWNEMCDRVGSCDEVIYSMYTFDELFYGREPLDIVSLVERTNFCSSDDYFSFDRSGVIESFNDPEDYSCYDIDALVNFLIEYGDDDTSTVDRDELTEYFDEEYGYKYPDGFDMAQALSDLLDEWTFDLLTDDWDEIDEELRKFKNIDEE